MEAETRKHLSRAESRTRRLAIIESRIRTLVALWLREVGR